MMAQQQLATRFSVLAAGVRSGVGVQGTWRGASPNCWHHPQGWLRAITNTPTVCADAATSQQNLSSSSTTSTSTAGGQADPSTSTSSSSGNDAAAAGPTSPSSSACDADGYTVAYQGFFARPHKRLKYASLLNTFASFAAAPLIVTYSSASPVARVAVTVSVLAFAIITTGGLHWFTSPYVHQLLYNSQSDTAKVQTLSFLGGTKWHAFPVSAVQAPTGYHPLASFEVLNKTFYVDRGNFEDADLLARLVPGSSADMDGSSGSSGDGGVSAAHQEHKHSTPP